MAIASRRRFNVLACGRRFGKTELEQLAAIHPALMGFPVGWFAPNYKYLMVPFRALTALLAPIGRISKVDKRIELITGGSIDFWSLTDEDAGRSYKYKRVLIDEAGMVAALESKWFDAIRPTLTDYRGDAWLAGTPKGRNFFYTAFMKGLDELDQDWSAIQMPTVNNPYIDPEEVDAARRQMPERSFRQEYLAEFLEDGGGVFRSVKNAVDTGRSQNEAPQSGRIYSLGVDLARVEDFTVLSVMDDLGRQVYHERFNQISWERQIEAITSTAKRYKARVLVDSTGVGDPIYERLRARDISAQGYTFTHSSKEQLIDNLAMLIEQGRVSLMDLPAQTNELIAYQYELSANRTIRMNAPEGMNDDCVIALALSVWRMKDRPAGGSGISGRQRHYV